MTELGAGDDDLAQAAEQVADYERTYNAFMLGMLDELHGLAAELAAGDPAALDEPAGEELRGRAERYLAELAGWHDRHPPPREAVWPPLEAGDFPRPDLPRASHGLQRLAEEEASWTARLRGVAGGAPPRSLFDPPVQAASS